MQYGFIFLFFFYTHILEKET